jgi:DNA/RNA endonuclease YhcR with UshA esterase domain
MKRNTFVCSLVSIAFLSIGSVFADDNTSQMQPGTSGDQSQSASQPSQPMSQSAAKPGVKTEVKVSQLNKQPDKFADQQVTVKGKVSRLESANSFVLEGSGIFNNRILVVVASPQTAQQGAPDSEQAGAAMPTIKEKAKLQVTGQVKEYSVVDVERTYNLKLKPEIKAEFEGPFPVLVVQPRDIKNLS